MGKVKKFNLYEDYEMGLISRQEVVDPDGEVCGYYVYPLYDCPEDAIVERALVSANEWLSIINRGIQLGKLGYDEAVLVDVDD